MPPNISNLEDVVDSALGGAFDDPLGRVKHSLAAILGMALAVLFLLLDDECIFIYDS